MFVYFCCCWVGDECTYVSCIDGYELSAAGSVVRTCGVASGTAQWSGSAKICSQMTTTAAPATTNACTGLRRARDAETCRERCNADGLDSMFFYNYDGCTHVCTCGCRSEYRLTADADKCQDHCDSIGDGLTGTFHTKYDGCSSVCMCERETPERTDPIAAAPEYFYKYDYEPFGYVAAGYGNFAGVANPTKFSNFDDGDTIILTHEVKSILDCTRFCDSQSDCVGVGVIRRSSTELLCRSFSAVSDVSSTTSKTISLLKSSVDGSEAEAEHRDPGTLDLLAGDGSRDFTAGTGEEAATTTGFKAVGAISQMGPRHLLVPLMADHYLVRIDLFDGGTHEVLAGTGEAGNSGVGGPPEEAQLDTPTAVVADVYGSIYIAEAGNHRISRITHDETSFSLSVVVGTGRAGHRGMGGDGAAAQINEPRGLAIDALGFLYISDQANHVIYQYDTSTHVIELLAGTPGQAGFRVADGLASQALLNRPTGLAVHSGNGQLFVADTNNNRIREIDILEGTIGTTAGAGPAGDGDGVFLDAPGASALFYRPEGVAVDENEQYVIVADTQNNAIRAINLSDDDRTVSHVLGSGHRAYNGDDHAPRYTRLRAPSSVLFSNAERAITFADRGNRRVRRVWGGKKDSQSHLAAVLAFCAGGKDPLNQHICCPGLRLLLAACLCSGLGCFGCVVLPIESCSASSSYDEGYTCDNAYDGVWSDARDHAW